MNKELHKEFWRAATLIRNAGDNYLALAHHSTGSKKESYEEAYSEHQQLGRMIEDYADDMYDKYDGEKHG